MHVAQPIAYNIAPGKGALKDDIHVTTADATKTLDASGSNPAMHQGGAAILQPIALAENIIGRKPENGGNHDGFTENGPMYTLNATGVHGVAHAFKVRGGCEGGGKGYLGSDDVAFTISTTQDQQIAQPMAVAQAVASCETAGTLRANPGSGFRSNGTPVEGVAIQAMAVRRLTPVECERLQGFPDSYTDIQPKGKATPDGPRYKALGNSMAVPVMAWIGTRIQEMDAILKTRETT
jgi:DNA (cytosine-5)-methyltransferase 1